MGHHILRRAANLAFAFLLALMSVNISGVLALQTAHAADGLSPITPTDGKLTICHSHQPNPSNGGGLGPQDNPYNSESVAIDAVDGDGNNDHTSHTGVADGQPSHVFHPGDLSWGDIIPAYPAGTYKQGSHDIPYPAYEGLNWTLEGKAIYDNGCVIPQDATADVTTNPATCAGAGSATVTGLAFATLNGVLSQTVGPNTATFTAATGHYFPGYATTKTVQYTIAAQLPAQQCLISVTPTAPVFLDPCKTANDTFTITATPGVTYKFNGILPAPAKTYTPALVDYLVGVTITAHPDSGYVLTGQTSWHYKFTNAACTATATKPVLKNECGTANDRFIIPKIEGVQYQVSKFGILYTNIDDGSYWGEGTFYVRAIAKPGYTLTGSDNAWTLYLNPNFCRTDANVKFNDVCGTSKDKFTIDPADHVTYKIATKWFLFIPIEFKEIDPGTYPAGGLVKIVAVPDDGYYVHGDWFWIHNFDSSKCELDAVGDPTFTDKCGVADDSYTIEPAQGVTYKVNGVITPAGSYNYPDAAGSVTITAEATDPDYVLAGDPTWSHNFLTDTCPDLSATAICDREGVIVTIKNDGDTEGTASVDGFADPFTVPGNSSIKVVVPLVLFKANVNVIDDHENTLLDKPFDCTPGRGGAGGEEPQGPPVITTVSTRGIELPQTGGTANALAQFLTVIVSGILTYGAVFALVNRRELFNK